MEKRKIEKETETREIRLYVISPYLEITGYFRALFVNCTLWNSFRGCLYPRHWTLGTELIPFQLGGEDSNHNTVQTLAIG